MVCERQQDPVILGGGLPVGAGRLGRSQSREACTLPVAKLHARGDSGALGTTFALLSETTLYIKDFEIHRSGCYISTFPQCPHSLFWARAVG